LLGAGVAGGSSLNLSVISDFASIILSSGKVESFKFRTSQGAIATY
jgi:hypothetical protein